MKFSNTKIFRCILFSALFLLLLNSQITAAPVSIKFTVDMTYQINQGTFNSSIDKVYLRGLFNNRRFVHSDGPHWR